MVGKAEILLPKDGVHRLLGAQARFCFMQQLPVLLAATRQLPERIGDDERFQPIFCKDIMAIGIKVRERYCLPRRPRVSAALAEPGNLHASAHRDTEEQSVVVAHVR